MPLEIQGVKNGIIADDYENNRFSIMPCFYYNSKKYCVINNYIDNRFEIEFYNRTNRFTRLFISENKKSELEYEYTFLYRQKAQYIANITTLITILIIIFFAIFLQLRIK